MREWMTMTWRRLAALIRRTHVEQEIDDELAFHAAMAEGRHREAGRADEDARRRARQAFGNPAVVREELHELWRWGGVERLWQDARFAFRLWRRHPAFAALAIVTLGLGIGAATVMFSLIDSTLLRPFPFRDPAGLLIVWETNLDRQIRTFTGSRLNYRSWQEDTSGFAHLAAWNTRSDVRTGGGTPERVKGSEASASLLEALGLQPVAGRWFIPEEDRPGAPRVAVLGHGYWQRQFGAQPAALGSTVIVNGEPHTIIGVAPDLPSPFDAEIWRPLAIDPQQLDRGDHDVFVVGRLAPSMTAARAEAELQASAARLAQAFPETNRGWSVRTEPIDAAFVSPETRRGLAALMAGVTLLLLIACANVANLLLVRGAGRAAELAMRAALGAARGRLARQLLTESLLLAAAGGAFGLLLAAWGIAGLRTLPASVVPGLADISLNGLVLVFLAALAGATTLAFGLLPALQFSRGARATALRTTSRTTTEGRPTRMLRQGFVIAEIALAFMLLVGAALLAQSVVRLQQVPLGFVPDGVLTADLGLYDARYRDDRVLVGFLDRLLVKLQETPGVTAAGVASSVPLGSGATSMSTMPESAADSSAGALQADWRVVSTDYFRAVGMPLLQGRSFLPEDVDRPGRVAVISRALADRLWPGESPLGRRMLVSDSRRPYEIVGVVGDARHLELGRDADPVMFFPYQRFTWATMTVTIRTPGDPAALAGALQAAVASIDPAVVAANMQPMRALVDRAASEPRLQAGLAMLFAVLACVLAIVGVYGVISYSATARTAEVAVRLALGAAPRDVRSMVFGEGFRLMALGLAAGALAAMAAAPLLARLLFGVSAFDPLTYAVAAATLAGVGAVATDLPARRAMRIDPVAALRQN